LYVPGTTAAGALATMIAGIGTALAVHVATAGRGWGLLSPAVAGLAAATAVWVITLALHSRPLKGRLHGVFIQV
jgi:hypothetical protein